MYNYDTLCERLRESAFLLKGFKIELIDKRHDRQDIFHYETGIQAFVSYLNEEKDSLHPVVFLKGFIIILKLNLRFNLTMVILKPFYHLLIMFVPKTGNA